MTAKPLHERLVMHEQECASVMAPGSDCTCPCGFDHDGCAAIAEGKRFVPGQRVLVTLRWQERGGRGKVRHYEQVRLGTVVEWVGEHASAEDREVIPGRVVVKVPGYWHTFAFQDRSGDVVDAMAEGRR